MSIPPEDSYLKLYELSKGTKPYQPKETWCANTQFAVTEFLHSKEKSKFIPDEILLTKREFIKDNF